MCIKGCWNNQNNNISALSKCEEITSVTKYMIFLLEEMTKSRAGNTLQQLYS
jgi:hypothetical protein